MNSTDEEGASVDGVTLYNADCLEVLKGLPAGYVDAVVTDPPYGLKWSESGFLRTNHLDHAGIEKWDVRPSDDLIRIVARAGRHAIIWGGNYFANVLGSFVSPFIWDKRTGKNYFADGELAWTSFKTGTLRIFRHQWCGSFRDSERGVRNVHPTQKPVALMRWCLEQLPEDCHTILDPFMGSGTTGVACVQTGRRFIGVEIDPGYFEIARRRILAAQPEAPLFASQEPEPEVSLFAEEVS